MADAHKVIATAGIISVATGSVNSLGKNHQLPSAKFLIGSGVVFLALSALAEGEPEVAKALSLAIMTTVLLGQGDGVLSYLNGKGEIDTTKPKKTAARNPNTADAQFAVNNDSEQSRVITLWRVSPSDSVLPNLGS